MVNLVRSALLTHVIPVAVACASAGALVAGDHAAHGSSIATESATLQLDVSRVTLPDRLVEPAHTARDRLSQAEAVSLALENNPAFRAARHRVAAARGTYRSRSAANNPELSFGATLVPDESDEPGEARSQFPDTDETNLKYTFPTSGRRRHRTRAAEAELAEAVATLETERLELVSKVKQGYVDLQVAQAVALVQVEAYRISTSLGDAARAQHRLGLVPETNILRTRIDAAQAEQELLRSRADARVKGQQLGLLIGHPVGRRIVAADPLDETTVTAPLEELLAVAEVQRPEVVAASHALAAARAAVDLARADRRPDLTVQTAFIDGLTNSGNPPIKGWISLPLWDNGLIAGEVERARAEVAVREQLLEQARRQVRTEVATAIQQLEAARQVLQLSGAEILPYTRSLLDKARSAYASGLGTLLDVLDAQRVYRQASLDRLRAIGDHQRAVAVLERAVGRVITGAGDRPAGVGRGSRRR